MGAVQEEGPLGKSQCGDMEGCQAAVSASVWGEGAKQPLKRTSKCGAELTAPFDGGFLGHLAVTNVRV